MLNTSVKRDPLTTAFHFLKYAVTKGELDGASVEEINLTSRRSDSRKRHAPQASAKQRNHNRFPFHLSREPKIPEMTANGTILWKKGRLHGYQLSMKALDMMTAMSTNEFMDSQKFEKVIDMDSIRISKWVATTGSNMTYTTVFKDPVVKTSGDKQMIALMLIDNSLTKLASEEELRALEEVKSVLGSFIKCLSNEQIMMDAVELMRPKSFVVRSSGPVNEKVAYLCHHLHGSGEWTPEIEYTGVLAAKMDVLSSTVEKVYKNIVDARFFGTSTRLKEFVTAVSQTTVVGVRLDDSVGTLGNGPGCSALKVFHGYPVNVETECWAGSYNVIVAGGGRTQTGIPTISSSLRWDYSLGVEVLMFNTGDGSILCEKNSLVIKNCKIKCSDWSGAIRLWKTFLVWAGTFTANKAIGDPFFKPEANRRWVQPKFNYKTKKELLKDVLKGELQIYPNMSSSKLDRSPGIVNTQKNIVHKYACVDVHFGTAGRSQKKIRGNIGQDLKILFEGRTVPQLLEPLDLGPFDSQVKTSYFFKAGVKDYCKRVEEICYTFPLSLMFDTLSSGKKLGAFTSVGEMVSRWNSIDDINVINSLIRGMYMTLNIQVIALLAPFWSHPDAQEVQWSFPTSFNLGGNKYVFKESELTTNAQGVSGRTIIIEGMFVTQRDNQGGIDGVLVNIGAKGNLGSRKHHFSISRPGRTVPIPTVGGPCDLSRRATVSLKRTAVDVEAGIRAKVPKFDLADWKERKLTENKM